MREITISANGLEFHALTAGPDDGPLVLLLHGFPELALSWRNQIPALAAAGYRAVAFDQRGYGTTTPRKGPYDAKTLTDDVAAVIEALGAEKAFAVGHDWGGGVAWPFAHLHPDLLLGLAVANCPPPSVLGQSFLTSPQQLKKSWYMFMFQIPWLPERLLSKDKAANIARTLKGGSYRKNAFTQHEIDEYRKEFAKPGAAQAALGWYRAAVRHPLRSRKQPGERITAPTLILWGTKDRFLGQELVSRPNLAKVLAPGNIPETVFFDDAGHFVQNEVPEQFTKELIAWLDQVRLQSQQR